MAEDELDTKFQIRERLSGETAKAYALREISDNIINLELKPGALVSENELAKMLGVSKSTFSVLLHNNEIPYKRVGKKFIIPRKEFMEWLSAK